MPEMKNMDTAHLADFNVREVKKQNHVVSQDYYANRPIGNGDDHDYIEESKSNLNDASFDFDSNRPTISPNK